MSDKTAKEILESCFWVGVGLCVELSEELSERLAYRALARTLAAPLKRGRQTTNVDVSRQSCHAAEHGAQAGGEPQTDATRP